MAIIKRPALEKNPHIKNLKNDSLLRSHKILSKSKSSNVVLDNKLLINHKVLGSRVAHKVRNLSANDKKLAEKLYQDMFKYILSNTFHFKNNLPKYTEFLKEFAKSINRKEGKEVLEILKKTSQLVVKI